MKFPPDLIEQQIATIDQAWELLNSKLPQFNQVFTTWQSWYKDIVTDTLMHDVIIDTLAISYARMALRNGTLSIAPRCYHNEQHIDDLLYRLIAVSKLSASEDIPEYGWSLLSIFMSCHDLRQSEVSNLHGLIGYNEQASFQETARLIAQIDQHKVIRQEHKELLKLMIHGSTFGKGEVNIGDIYTGNLVEYILQNIEYFDATDKEIAYIACDIDTANVAADLTDYTKSSMNVYNEMQNISNGKISAQTFFGKQQIQYFFELQKFHSKLGAQAFAQQKAKNAPKIKQLSNVIQQLDSSLTNDEIIDIYLTHAGSQL